MRPITGQTSARCQSIVRVNRACGSEDSDIIDMLSLAEDELHLATGLGAERS